MAATAFDSFYFRDRYGSPAMRAIWDDRAMIQRWLDVEAALARAQAELGLVPQAAAREIARRRARRPHRPARDEARVRHHLEPGDAARERAARAAAAQRPPRWVHWGATSKNIIDTALALQIKDSYDVVLARAGRGRGARSRASPGAIATRVMAGRTHGQHALPVTLRLQVRGLARRAAAPARAARGEPAARAGGRVRAAPWGRWPRSAAPGLRVQERLMQRLGLGVPADRGQDRGRPLRRVLPAARHALGHPRQDRAEHLQPAGDRRGRGQSSSSEGKVGSSAMPHKLNPVASGLGGAARRACCARGPPPILDYVHSEWEDDHRQGETAWAFPQEVCLLLGAQLAISAAPARHAWSSSPRTCAATSTASGGVVLSEAVMMALAPKLGRATARTRSCCAAPRESLQRGVPFREAVRRHPEVRAHLSPAADRGRARLPGLAGPGRLLRGPRARAYGGREPAASADARRRIASRLEGQLRAELDLPLLVPCRARERVRDRRRGLARRVRRSPPGSPPRC